MNQNNIKKKNYLLFIYLFFHFFQIIIADCASDCQIIDKKCYHLNDIVKMCESYCLPNLVNNKCYDCRTVSASDYYYINSNNECVVNNCNGKKVIYNTKQCISGSCESSSLYGIGDTDYCYTTQDCSKDNKKIIDNQCDCEYLFSIEVDNGKKYKHCYANNEYCGPEHSAYNSDTKECGNNCPSGWKKKIITRSGESYITRCSQNCLNSEYIDGDYCISDCPIGKFIYDNSGTK